MSKGSFAQKMIEIAVDSGQLAMDQASRYKRMVEQGFETGYWRGGKSIADGPYYTPDESAARDFAERHAGADVREYAIRRGNSFDFGGTIKTDEMGPIVEAVAKDNPKLAKELADLPDDWGGEMPKSMLWQVLETQTGGNTANILARAGYDTIDAGQELITLHKKGLVRDLNAAFDPAQKASSNPFAAIAGLGTAGLAGGAMLSPDQANAGEIDQQGNDYVTRQINDAMKYGKGFAYQQRYDAPKNETMTYLADQAAKYNKWRKENMHPVADFALPVGELPEDLFRKASYGDKVKYMDVLMAELGLL